MKRKKEKELLRFSTAGSVDDGKSTLIGRLLYDSKSIFEDQLNSVEKTSKKKGLEHLDLSLLTDGLKDEREQGITIDVAYRYFSTPKRKFIIADTPGHIQYTRNMVTGASTSNCAVILIDSRNGVVEQTKRHTFIASLLQIPHFIVCINKMDLVDFSEDRFNEVVEEFKDFSASLAIKDIRFIPISALHGDNVVDKSTRMNWYTGRTLLDALENIHITNDINLIDARFPIQTIIRPHSEEHHDFRGYAGKVASGVFHQGDKIKVLPSGFESQIKAIHTYDGEVKDAFAPMSVVMTLTNDIDVARGDMMVRVQNVPEQKQEFDVILCWLHQSTANPRTKYYIRHTSNEAVAIIKEVKYKIDINTLHRNTENNELKMNDIARITIKTTKPLFIDKYSENRITGSIILVDQQTNETVAAGMIK